MTLLFTGTGLRGSETGAHSLKENYGAWRQHKQRVQTPQHGKFPRIMVRAEASKHCRNTQHYKSLALKPYVTHTHNIKGIVGSAMRV